MINVMTYAGINNEISEDNVLVDTQIYNNICLTTKIIKESFVCIADGVGGNDAGQIASSYVLKALSSYKWKNDDDFKNELIKLNHELVLFSNSCNGLSNMATTLSGVYIKDNEIKMVHIGNSRIYVLQRQYLKQLTVDHTTYNWLMNLGRFEEAKVCNKNEIISCFGGGNENFLENLQITSIGFTNTIFMTSDGIHEYVNIDKLEEIMNLNISNNEKLNIIKEEAIANGSNDDMTAVIINI